MRIELTAWSEQVESLPADVAAELARSSMVDVRVAEPPERWRLVTDSRVGVLTVGEWDVRVTPKLEVPRLMFLLGYAADPRGWRELGPTFDADDDLFSAVAHGFALQAERAMSPAPLRGYVAVDEREFALRGRLRIGDQLARRPGLPIPLELTYDDHIVDVPENRLIRGAAELLLRVPHVPKAARLRLLRIRASLEDVDPTRPSPSVRAPAIARLNARYAGAMALAELILRGVSLHTSHGRVASAAFVFDMNKVFEDFLSTALQVALERHGGRVRFQYNARYLDEAHRLRLKPDITWWRDGACRAVIDAKYKALAVSGIPTADAYQMLAYCIAFGLESGHLVYAKDAGQEPRDHVVSGLGTRILVSAIDVEREPDELLAEVDALAAAIAGMDGAQLGTSDMSGRALADVCGYA